MKKTLKNNAKSIRISDFTLTCIEAMEGEGFNQKLENMVYRYACAEKDLQRRIESLEYEERQLKERINKLMNMERDLTRIKSYISEARRLADNAPLTGQMGLKAL